MFHLYSYFVEGSREIVRSRSKSRRLPRSVFARFAAVLGIAILAGCVHAGGMRTPAKDGVPIWVTSHGWHTGIVLPAAAMAFSAPKVLPELEGFRYLEFGWGDERFYRSGTGSAWLAVRALFWPTASALHVAGFDAEPSRYFAASRVLRLELSRNQVAALARFVERTVSRNAAGEAETLGRGLYGESRFYRANGSYLFPETCNVWTARGLGAAGCRVRPFLAMTADGVLRQARRCGAVEEAPGGSERGFGSERGRAVP